MLTRSSSGPVRGRFGAYVGILCNRLEVINAAGGIALAILILPGTVLMKHEFNNNIDDTVLFATNTETSTGYTNDQLAIDWLEHFECAT